MRKPNCSTNNLIEFDIINNTCNLIITNKMTSIYNEDNKQGNR